MSFQSFGSWNGHWYSPTWKWLLLVWPIGDSPNPKHQSNKPWGRCNTPVYTYNVGPPSDVRWFINTMNTIVIGTINHSYWSYLHQLSYLGGLTLYHIIFIFHDFPKPALSHVSPCGHLTLICQNQSPSNLLPSNSNISSQPLPIPWNLFPSTVSIYHYLLFDLINFAL